MGEADLQGALDDVPQGDRSGPVALVTGQPEPGRPPAVAVHDDRDVPREMSLGYGRRAGTVAVRARRQRRVGDPRDEPFGAVGRGVRRPGRGAVGGRCRTRAGPGRRPRRGVARRQRQPPHHGRPRPRRAEDAPFDVPGNPNRPVQDGRSGPDDRVQLRAEQFDRAVEHDGGAQRQRVPQRPAGVLQPFTGLAREVRDEPPDGGGPLAGQQLGRCDVEAVEDLGGEPDLPGVEVLGEVAEHVGEEQAVHETGEARKVAQAHGDGQPGADQHPHQLLGPADVLGVRALPPLLPGRHTLTALVPPYRVQGGQQVAEVEPPVPHRVGQRTPDRVVAGAARQVRLQRGPPLFEPAGALLRGALGRVDQVVGGGEGGVQGPAGGAYGRGHQLHQGVLGGPGRADQAAALLVRGVECRSLSPGPGDGPRGAATHGKPHIPSNGTDGTDSGDSDRLRLASITFPRALPEPPEPFERSARPRLAATLSAALSPPGRGSARAGRGSVRHGQGPYPTAPGARGPRTRVITAGGRPAPTPGPVPRTPPRAPATAAHPRRVGPGPPGRGRTRAGRATACG